MDDDYRKQATLFRANEFQEYSYLNSIVLRKLKRIEGWKVPLYYHLA
jgi:hypothetical protein